MDLELKYLEETELVALDKSLFKWIESFPDNVFDQIMDAIIHFDNDFDEEATIVFTVHTNDEVQYYKFEVGLGIIELQGMIGERDMYVIEFLGKIDVDEFLDNVIEGNQIIKNKEIKRIILNYSLIWKRTNQSITDHPTAWK